MWYPKKGGYTECGDDCCAVYCCGVEERPEGMDDAYEVSRRRQLSSGEWVNVYDAGIYFHMF